jgi:hypothetical protein
MLLAAASCTSNLEDSRQTGQVPFSVADISTEVLPFKGEELTRANLQGNQFEAGDLIRLKLICPFSNEEQFGENTWGASMDNFYLLTWGGANSNWQIVGSDRGFDIDNNFSISRGPGLYYLSQATPYVFTACTWTEEVCFVAGGTRYDQYRSTFYADQSDEKAYKGSDILWAQQIMQTGSDNARLSFRHVMSAVKVTLNAKVTVSADAILSIEGLPDIDQEEICVGNYYSRSDRSSLAYGDKQKSACTLESENGKALGYAVNNTAASTASRVPFAKAPQDATYTAFRSGSDFYLIVPPYTPTKNPVICLRDGAKRWSATLPLKDTDSNPLFEAGTQYNITLNITSESKANAKIR